MSRLRIASALLALTVGAAACTDNANDPSTTPATDLSGDDIVLTSALVTVDSCDALLDRLKTEGLERVGPYGFGGGHFGILEEGMAVDEAMTADDSADFDAAATPTTAAQAAGESAGSDGAGDDFSGTNNQEVGVDEADRVKTDGRRLVVVAGNRLEVIDVEGDQPRLINTIDLPEDFYGGEIFLAGDTALMMTSGWTAIPFQEDAADLSWFPGSPTGRIIEIDLDEGEVLTTLEFEGAYLSAREVDGSIRIVLSANQNRFSFVLPSNPGAEDTAEAANRSLIEDSTIDMWIPTFRLTGPDGVVTEGPIVECDRVHLPTEFAGFGSLAVLTVDVEDGFTVEDSLSVFTDAQTVYASPTNLSVATPRWPEFTDEGEPAEIDDYRTALHSFDISDPTRTEYTASGSVRGHVLNQYSMSEHEGYLRVATTDGTPWDSRDSESFVTVLAEEGTELVQVGQVGGLGRGERIFAVRFLGDMGYVVTFEQVDPLYTVDLSDPENPTTRGELKIPGVSDYLHPYGEYLIGVGRDGDDEGLTGGAVVSLFDVADPDEPTLVDKVSLAPPRPDGLDWYDSQSPVSWDPKAFNIWDETVIVPVSWWGVSEGEGDFQEFNGSAASLVRVDADAGTLTPVGRVGHPAIEQCEGGPIPVEEGPGGIVVETDTETDIDGDTEAEAGSGDAEADFVREAPAAAEEPPADSAEVTPVPEEGRYCWTYQPEVQRTVVIGDNLYTISDAGVAVNRFDGLDTVVWIPFEQR